MDVFWISSPRFLHGITSTSLPAYRSGRFFPAFKRQYQAPCLYYDLGVDTSLLRALKKTVIFKLQEVHFERGQSWLPCVSDVLPLSRACAPTQDPKKAIPHLTAKWIIWRSKVKCQQIHDNLSPYFCISTRLTIFYYICNTLK